MDKKKIQFYAVYTTLFNLDGRIGNKKSIGKIAMLIIVMKCVRIKIRKTLFFIRIRK